MSVSMNKCSKSILAQEHETNQLCDEIIEGGVDHQSPDRLPEKHIVAFYCNAGEHRSVAFAALYAELLRQLGFAVKIVHVCRSLWDRRSCGQCIQCREVPARAPTNRFRSILERRRAMWENGVVRRL